MPHHQEVPDPGDVTEMRKKAAERAWDRRREFFEVSDIDEFLCLRPASPKFRWPAEI